MEKEAGTVEQKRLFLTIVVICLVGMVTGLFLAGAILPFRAPAPDYIETSADAARMLNVVHADETHSQHEHTVTTIVTVKETSPHGFVHNFLAALTTGL